MTRKVISGFFTLLVCFLSLSIHAQDTAALNQLNKLSEFYQDKNTDSALRFANEALSDSRKKNYIQGELSALNNLGWIHYRKGIYKKASEFAFFALSLAEKTGNHLENAKANNTIGSVYNDQAVPLNSMLYFNRALEQYTLAKNKAGKGRVLNNLAYTALKANMPDSALYFSNKAVAINSTLPDKYYLAFTYRTLGDIYKLKREYSDAYNFFQKSLTISTQLGNNFLSVTNLNRLGLLENEMGKNDSAQFFYLRAEQLGTKHGFRSILTQAYEGLAKTYAVQNNYRTAYEYQKAFSKLNDSLKSAANTETISILQSNYETEKRDGEIRILKKDQDLQKIRLAEQKQFITTLVIVVVLIFLFAIFMFRRYSYEKQFNKKINDQAEQLSRMNNQLKGTVNFKDKVLSILSHDLRSPLATLTGTLIMLDDKMLTNEEFAAIRQKLNRQLSSLNMTVENILQWAMTQVKNDVRINKEKTDVSTVIAEAVQLAEPAALQKKIQFRITQNGSTTAFADPNHIRIVVRNLIMNALKFSYENSEVEISSEELQHEIKLAVIDHGVGIPKDQQSNIFNPQYHHSTYGTSNEKGTGIGLILAKEFVELNGGTISYESSGNGTRFYFTFPKFA